ncbi:MAG: hypothetical protein AAGI53_15845 [Planctomycetota bacterium]
MSPKIAQIAALSVVTAVSAASAQTLGCCGPEHDTNGFRRIDLRQDLLATGGTEPIAETLVAVSGTGLQALFPRSGLNAAFGEAMPGTQYVIGAIPEWLAAQHGLLPTDEPLGPPPPTLLDRALGLDELDRRLVTAIATVRRIEPVVWSTEAKAERRTAFATASGVSVRTLLLKALASERRDQHVAPVIHAGQLDD